MCEARTELQDLFVPAQRQPLDVVPPIEPDSPLEFPVDLSDASPERIREYDKEALLLVGSRGVPDPYGTFTVLENWLRFPRQSRDLAARLTESPSDEQERRLQRAAEYLVNLRIMDIDPPPPRARPEDRLPDRNLALYQRFDFFQEIAHQAQRNPGEHLHPRRLRLARISIFAALLYAREENLEMPLPSRIHVRAARRPGQLVQTPHIQEEYL